ncbi:MAG: MauE/DoxX family redox-associated membrane protein [Planctomycetota bacterium]
MTPEPPLPARPGRAFLASSLVRAIGLWVAVGALFKLLAGSPNSLPPVVLDFPFPADMGVKYKAILGIELLVVALALLRPRWGWLAGGALLAGFVVVLLLTLGEPSCGCFGEEITMPPWAMLAIDGPLLAALLALRPWRTVRGRGLPRVVVVAAVAIGIAAPWFHDRELKGTLTIDGVEQTGSRKWIAFDLAQWAGRDIGKTELAQVLAPDELYALPPDGLWVFWRSTCDHCAEHMAHLAETERGERMITLLRLNEPTDTEGNRVVHTFPEGSFVVRADLPDRVDYVVTTPGELEMQSFVVVRGEEAVGLDEAEREEARAEEEARKTGATAPENE